MLSSNPNSLQLTCSVRTCVERTSMKTIEMSFLMVLASKKVCFYARDWSREIGFHLVKHSQTCFSRFAVLEEYVRERLLLFETT